MRAASLDFGAIVTLLIDAGAYTEVRDAEHMTPLLRACARGKVRALVALLKGGANVRVIARPPSEGGWRTDEADDSPMGLATDGGHQAVMEVLYAWSAQEREREREAELAAQEERMRRAGSAAAFAAVELERDLAKRGISRAGSSSVVALRRSLGAEAAPADAPAPTRAPLDSDEEEEERDKAAAAERAAERAAAAEAQRSFVFAGPDPSKAPTRTLALDAALTMGASDAAAASGSSHARMSDKRRHSMGGALSLANDFQPPAAKDKERRRSVGGAAPADGSSEEAVDDAVHGALVAASAGEGEDAARAGGGSGGGADDARSRGWLRWLLWRPSIRKESKTKVGEVVEGGAAMSDGITSPIVAGAGGAGGEESTTEKPFKRRCVIS
jgi:hypothetical protein